MGIRATTEASDRARPAPTVALMMFEIGPAHHDRIMASTHASLLKHH
jgi:hypothetical protein